MSVAKVIEIIGEGDSIENAMASAVKAASKSVRNIKSVWVQDIQATTKGKKIDRYRVNTKITFVVD